MGAYFARNPSTTTPLLFHLNFIVSRQFLDIRYDRILVDFARIKLDPGACQLQLEIQNTVRPLQGRLDQAFSTQSNHGGNAEVHFLHSNITHFFHLLSLNFPLLLQLLQKKFGALF
jgi:hypothetical protein